MICSNISFHCPTINKSSPKKHEIQYCSKVWFWHFIWKLPKVCKIQAISGIEMLQKWTFCCKKGGKMVNSSLLSKPNYENVEVDFMVIFWTICITQRIWRDLTRRQIGKKGLHFPNWTISLAFELSENDFAKCCCWCRCSNFSFVSDGFGHSVCSRESNFDFS